MLLDDEGHVQFFKTLELVAGVPVESRLAYIRSILKYDSANYPDTELDRRAQDIMDISTGTKPMPEYCTEYLRPADPSGRP